MPLDPARLAEAAAALRRAKRVVVLSGAGMSAESGIATFRDAGGFWSRFPPDVFANWPGLVRTALARPRRLAEFLIAVFEPIAAARPNAGHLALARLGRHAEVAVVTQNIDGLHQEAGSTTVHEIHGSLLEVVTLRGRFVRRISRAQLRDVAKALKAARGRRFTLLRALRAVRPVLGIGRHGVYRPRVVLFGEAMAEPDWSRAVEAAGSCDCFLTVGTSGMVWPAADLPALAQAAGAALIWVDPSGGPGDHCLEGTAAEVLPALVDAAFG